MGVEHGGSGGGARAGAACGNSLGAEDSGRADEDGE